MISAITESTRHCPHAGLTPHPCLLPLLLSPEGWEKETRRGWLPQQSTGFDHEMSSGGREGGHVRAEMVL